MLEFEALNRHLGQEGAFKVQFVPLNPLPENSYLQIKLPESIDRSGGNVECTGIQNADEQLICQYDGLDHSILLRTGGASINYGTEKIVFLINGFKNP